MENLESSILNETDKIVKNSSVNQILHQVGAEVRKIMEEDYKEQNLSLVKVKESKIKWYLLSLTSRLKIDRTQKEDKRKKEEQIDLNLESIKEINAEPIKQSIMIDLPDAKRKRTSIELIDISKPKKRMQDDDLDIAR